MSQSTEPSDFTDLRRAFGAAAAVERYDKSTGSSDLADLRRAFGAARPWSVTTRARDPRIWLT